MFPKNRFSRFFFFTMGITTRVTLMYCICYILIVTTSDDHFSYS